MHRLPTQETGICLRRQNAKDSLVTMVCMHQTMALCFVHKEENKSAVSRVLQRWTKLGAPEGKKNTSLVGSR